jgi:hypothetical protein
MISMIWIIVFVAIYVVLPAVFVWGWIRWSQDTTPRTLISRLSFLGFCLASASELLALVTTLWAQVHPFPYYDPTLMKIFGLGSLLALLAICASFAGIWRKNALRWHALACGAGMLAFWTVAMSGE